MEVPVEKLKEVEKIILEGLIREGEFSTRDALIELFEKEVQNVVNNKTYKKNEDWIDGVNYCIYLIKNWRNLSDV
jgi:hypothetical protein